jgi:hypothetical protein
MRIVLFFGQNLFKISHRIPQGRSGLQVAGFGLFPLLAASA